MTAALVMAATSCAGSNGDAVTFQIFGDGAEIKAYETLIDAFEERNPGISVKLIPVPSQNDHAAKLAAGYAGGVPPDLFLINFRRVGLYAGRGVLEPLGARLDASATLSREDFYEQAIDAFVFGGTLVCLPQNVSSQVVYYNRALFQRFGLDEPEAGWTWQEFLDAARALTKDTDGDGNTDIYGLGIEPTFLEMAPWVWQAGAEVVDDTINPTQTVMLDDRALEALKFYIELRRVHRVVPQLAEAQSEDDDTRFGNGRLGMMIDSRRSTTAFRQIPDLDWDVVALPVHRRAATMLHSDAFCMSRSSSRKDAAWRFVEFALGPEGAAIIARTGRTVPSLRSVAEGPAFLDPTQKPVNAQAWLDAIPTIMRFPNIPTWNEIETRASVVVEEWFYGQERIEALGIEIDLATRELFAEPPPEFEASPG